ncbi:TPA: IS982 family transposase [Legionella pneumophila]|uniref:Putative transposase (DDE domain) n=1 Tax=Legionella longbeachae serogroup 1 (strain NSW150) TaxID=661367 RepID=D3HTM0_LEGLN|nr:IS982 family transposase [Legionella longbeachae]HAT2015081.1 IS982 family transposase [Legionella pneumophila]HCC3234031.1 IS982 family transposase [Legionella pneumophila subsp. pneumophila]ARM33361.1 IS982 family transposase [Legionella longbeachae]ARM35485.2 IS982 family transposase [Legionella longbeachae]EEZ94641.1 transposase IS4 family protein [Legionella longbeachae D-4968]
MSVEEFIIAVYCLVDDIMNELLNSKSLRQRGFNPALTDSEMIAMELVAEFQGIDTDKGAWEYFCNHWRALFPNIGSRANFAKHAANLWNMKQQIQKVLAGRMGAFTDLLHISDGFPVPVCHFRRANFSQVFAGEATYGYCASKGETYYGFKGNVLINSDGIITGITLSQAHIDERESLWDLVDGIHGMIIADKGLIGSEYQNELREYSGIDLQTAVRSNMEDKRGKHFSKWLTSTRRLVETVIGQLTERFQIEKVRARKLWYLTNRVARKVLAHTVCAYINKKMGNPPLQFELLVKS